MIGEAEWLLLHNDSYATRKGLVRLSGRVWVDDDGPFSPLGATLMWALDGLHIGDSARVGKNLDYLHDNHFDYVRIMATLGWIGNDAQGQPLPNIDPCWPDYEEVLADFIDATYDTYGMRTLISIMDRGVAMNPIKIARKIASIIPGREHKILYVEMSNEGNGVDAEQMRQMVAIIKPTGILTAPTSWQSAPNGDLPALMSYTRANVGTSHPDRDLTSPLDADWRQARQGWDASRVSFAMDLNEPVGPRSSIEENTDPLQLAMLRACGIIAGSGAFVLHNGAGVSGRIDPAHNRPANLWEVPGIYFIEEAVRSIDQFIPEGAENWTKTQGNINDPANPLRADHCWTDDNAAYGVVRLFSAYTDHEFVSLTLGVKGSTVVSRWDCSIDVMRFTGVDYGTPMKVESVVKNHSLRVGDTFRLDGRSDAHVAYIINGVR